MFHHKNVCAWAKALSPQTLVTFHVSKEVILQLYTESCTDTVLFWGFCKYSRKWCTMQYHLAIPYCTAKSHFSALLAACPRTIFMLLIFILLKFHYILPHCIVISTVQLYYVPKVICAALGSIDVQVRQIFLIPI